MRIDYPLRQQYRASINPRQAFGRTSRRRAEKDELIVFVLSFPVTHFVTFEFKGISVSTAWSKLETWHDHMEWLNRAAIGMVICLEHGLEGAHFHGVLMGAPNLNVGQASQSWKDLAGDPEIRRYDYQLGGCRYSFKEAYETGEWWLVNLEFYSPNVRRTRSRLTREYLSAHLARRS